MIIQTLATRRPQHDRYRLFSALMLAVLLLAACGGSPEAVVTEPTANIGNSQPATTQPTTSAGSPQASAPAVSAESSAEPTRVPPSTPLPSQAASAAAQQPTIAVVRPDNSVALAHGTERQPITSVVMPPICGDWQWSPDGYRLAMEGGVYTFGADATTPPILSPIAGGYFSWSKDGQRLAWLAGVDEHLDVIRVGGPDGDEAQVVAGAHWGSTGLIDWSGDGQLVAAGPLQATADGSSFTIVEGRGRNPTWSPDGQVLVWTTINVQANKGIVPVIAERNGTTSTLAEMTFPIPNDSGAAPMELERLALHWLPDSSALLIGVPNGILLNGGGTYLVRDGAARLVSPHQICDLAPDGQHMVARTANDQLVIERLGADGTNTTVVQELGPGIAAAWRPEPQGSRPPTPLADRSPQLMLTTPLAAGPAVTEVQQRLTEQGFDPGTVDGVFGERTQQAVRSFQEAEGLIVDGIVGPKTWAALRFDAIGTTQQFGAQPSQ